jgi:hypothetical protein
MVRRAREARGVPALRLGPPTEVLLKGRGERTLAYSCEGFCEPDTIFLIQSSFDRVSTRSREFGERFYANLFKANPQLMNWLWLFASHGKLFKMERHSSRRTLSVKPGVIVKFLGVEAGRQD